MGKIAMIVAVDRNNGIGRGGDQLVYISEDLKHFKATTTGHTVIMGRKTSNALPKGVLPKRRNIIVTRSAEWHIEGGEVAHSVEEVMEMLGDDEEAYVMGGGEIYKQFMPMAEKLVVTEIDAEYEGVDTYFPEINGEEWKREMVSEWMDDEKNGVRFRYVEYKRNL